MQIIKPYFFSPVYSAESPLNLIVSSQSYESCCPAEQRGALRGRLFACLSCLCDQENLIYGRRCKKKIILLFVLRCTYKTGIDISLFRASRGDINSAVTWRQRLAGTHPGQMDVLWGGRALLNRRFHDLYNFCPFQSTHIKLFLIW